MRVSPLHVTAAVPLGGRLSKGQFNIASSNVKENPFYFCCSGQRPDATLVGDSVVMGRLAPHITDLRLASMQAVLSQQCFENICAQLSCLRYLQLGCIDSSAGAIFEGVSAHITQLSKLQYLDISVVPDHALLPVTTELSKLTQLTHLHLGGSEDCLATLASLPSLQHLSLLGRGGNVFQMPTNIHLLAASLTALHMSTIQLVGDVCALSCLIALQQLSISGMIVPDTPATVAQMMCGLQGMTSLKHLCIIIPGLHTPIDFHVLSMPQLESLKIEDSNLQHFQCSSSWTSLTELSLGENCLSRLPEHLASLTALVRLDIAYQLADFQLDKPLDCLRSMPGLRTVDLTQGEEDTLADHTLLYPHDEVLWSRWSPGSLSFIAEAEELAPELCFSY